MNYRKFEGKNERRAGEKSKTRWNIRESQSREASVPAGTRGKLYRIIEDGRTMSKYKENRTEQGVEDGKARERPFVPRQFCFRPFIVFKNPPSLAPLLIIH